MSDGPHRSLPMSKAWKNFAKAADKAAYDLKDVSELAPLALRDDWIDQNCDEVVSRMSSILGDERQGRLFENQKLQELKQLQREVSPGFTLRRLLVDHAIKEVTSNPNGTQHCVDAVANGLQDHLARRSYQCEEHYHRESTEKRAANVGHRMEQAMSQCSFTDIAKQFLGQTAPTPRAPKQDSLDDGVTLP